MKSQMLLAELRKGNGGAVVWSAVWTQTPHPPYTHIHSLHTQTLISILVSDQFFAVSQTFLTEKQPKICTLALIDRGPSSNSLVSVILRDRPNTCHQPSLPNPEWDLIAVREALLRNSS